MGTEVRSESLCADIKRSVGPNLASMSLTDTMHGFSDCKLKIFTEIDDFIGD